uniref:serine/arginine repetitive matrix protein 4 isoform X2 n=1 Tax=Doryrhamphus excisus TaxID=161450 RepID=UPI0025AEA586|nr:serine/arginine repetitive matrix protein 4 isoform X2 [Doryrhamphus excisus]
MLPGIPAMMQTESSGQLGASLETAPETTAESAAILQQKQLFEKFWKGTFKAVATPRPESVIVASIIARTRLSRPQASQPPGDSSGVRKAVAAGWAAPRAGRNGCTAGKRRHGCHRRARSASFEKELSLRPKAKRKKRRWDKSKRRMRRSPSCSLSPLRRKKKKKKKKKSSKKGKRHRYGSKKSRQRSVNFKRKRKDEKRKDEKRKDECKQKKSSRTRSRRRRRQWTSALECSCCQSPAEDRRIAEARQTSGCVAATREGVKSVKTAAKYPSVFCTKILSSKLFEGTTSRRGGSPHDYDSGNDTSSPPSCKTAADGKSTEHQRAASEFAVKDNSSDSGNSVTSYTSLSKTCGDDGSRDHVTLGSFQTSDCSQRVSKSSGGRLRTQSRSRGRRKKKRRRRRSRSSGSSRYSRHQPRSLSSARSHSCSPSYSPAPRRRDTMSSTRSRGSYSRYSHDRLRSRRRTSSFGETDVEHKASRKRQRRKFYSPMRKRRRDSPSHLEARRITSARKRPIPYFRPSPSSCSSISSWSSLFSHSRIRSRSRNRSSSTSWSSYRSFSRSSSSSIFGVRGRGRSRPRH